MNKNVKISVSILSCDLSRIADEIAALEKAGADMIHLDVMDGSFVPNITFGPPVIRCIRPVTKLPFDAHLMIEKPERYIDCFKAAGCDILTVQAEACTHLQRVLSAIKSAGMKSGVALNPATSPDFLEYVLDVTDLVLVMSVNPGFSGQSFIESSLLKIKKIRDMIDRSGRDIYLEVDGGVSSQTSKQVMEAGADLLVASSAIFSSRDYADAIRSIKNPKGGASF